MLRIAICDDDKILVTQIEEIVLNDLLKNWVKSADEPFLFRVIFRYFD